MKNPPARAVILILFLLNIFLLQSFVRQFHREFRMTVLDVGQGDAIYLEFPEGGNLLMDAGKGGEGDRGRWVVAPFLKSKGVSAVDALVASHPQEDHIGGMPSLLDEFDIRNFFDAGSYYETRTLKRLEEKLRNKKARHFHASRGMEIKGFRDVGIDVLNPLKQETQDKNVNNECLVLMVRYKDTSFLLTGDVEERAMAELLDNGQDLRADVLKVPHHGSRLKAQGERFIRAVAPKISVISVGEHNAFHHPSKKTLDILSLVPGNRVFRTDRDNAIEIVSDGKNLMVKFSHVD